MKFDWATVVNEVRAAMLAHTKFEGIDRDHTLDLAGYFEIQMKHTDTFHAFDFDRDLDKAFSRLPTYCNYRSCEALQKYKQRRYELEDALYAYLEETSFMIDEHFANGWNFPPGYTHPKKIEFSDLEAVAAKVLPSMIRRCKVTV